MSDSEIDVIINDQSSGKPRLLFSCRFLIALILFLGASIQYIQKIDMGLAIVCMVNNTAIKNHNKTNDFDLMPQSRISFGNDSVCKFQPKNDTQNRDGPFVWDKNIQGWILSSYFYGYILTQVLSGWLSIRFGGKIVLGASILIGSIMTMLAVPSSKLGYFALIVCRFVTGLAHGLLWPAISSIFVNWAPPSEKSRLIGIASSGSYVGNVFALELGGYLCVSGFAGGWGSIFYIFGIIGIVWFILLMVLASDSPTNHKFIGLREREYINKSINTKGSSNSDDKTKLRPTPWKKIFTSKSCVAVFVSHTTVNWGNYLFLTQLPTFMKEVLKFDIKSNGFYSSLPYVTAYLVVVVSGLLGDKLIASKIISVTKVRKIFNGLGLFVPMVSVIILSFVTCAQPYWGVALLVIGIGFFGASTGAGSQVNCNEVGGSYSGIIYGISNTFATIPGIVAPYIVSVITKNQLQEEWRVVFYISAVIFLIGGTFYSIFASAIPDEWADAHDEKLLD